MPAIARIAPASVDFPGSAWVTHQARTNPGHAEDVDLRPMFVVQDLETKYAPPFDDELAGDGVIVQEITPGLPQFQGARRAVGADAPARRRRLFNAYRWRVA